MTPPSSDSEQRGALRVLHVHETPGFVGGSERSLHLSVDALGARGHASYLLCATTKGALGLPDVAEVIERAEVFNVEPLPPWRATRLARDLVALVDTVRPDVVHIRLGLSPFMVAALARRWPVVYTAHVPVCPNGARHWYRERSVCERRVGAGCFFVGFRSHDCGHLSTGAPVSIPAFLRSIRTTMGLLSALGRCRMVIASSRWQADMLRKDGVPRVAVVHPPIAALRRGVQTDPPVVAFAGRLVSLKGVDHLLRASRLIALPHRVSVIGDGPERAELETLAHAIGISDRVTFHGAVSPVETASLLAVATVVAMPSVAPETFGQAGAQAARAGIPVVAYDAGGIRDWARELPGAVTVPVGDLHEFGARIESALRQAHEVRRSPATLFSAEEHVSSLLEVYRTAIAEGEAVD